MAILLGCIADDFTGATDVASMLVKQGLRAIQTIGVLPGEPPPDDAESVVVALKTRTVLAARAIEQSLAALRWLRAAGCRRFYFKYCSTFDSTPEGNIGPVAEALMDELGVNFTVACPALPENGRTLYKGYLFVGDAPLDESSMRHHPLTPMTDANLVRVLARQAKRHVGLIDFASVSKGPVAVRERIAALIAKSTGIAIADALENRDLEVLSEACFDLPLTTGGSGLAWGLAGAIRSRGLVTPGIVADALPPAGGLRAVIAGSCSAATRTQVEIMRERHPSLRLGLDLLESGRAAETALEWAAPRVGKEPILIYSTGTPEEVKELQARTRGQGEQRFDRARARAYCTGPCQGSRRGAPHRGGRRDIRRSRRGARRQAPAHRVRDRSRRAMDDGGLDYASASPRHSAQIWEFWNA